jgi:hypothetical protein
MKIQGLDYKHLQYMLVFLVEYHPCLSNLFKKGHKKSVRLLRDGFFIR